MSVEAESQSGCACCNYKDYFPIKIRMQEGAKKGQEFVIEHHELPNNLAFVVLETNAKKETKNKI